MLQWMLRRETHLPLRRWTGEAGGEEEVADRIRPDGMGDTYTAASPKASSRVERRDPGCMRRHTASTKVRSDTPARRSRRATSRGSFGRSESTGREASTSFLVPTGWLRSLRFAYGSRRSA